MPHFSIDQGENNYVHNSVERFDVRTNSWETMRSMPIPRLGFGIAAVGHNVYIAGGMTGKSHPRIHWVEHLNSR